MSEIDLKALWKELDLYEIELSKESEALREVWLKIAEIKEQHDIEAEKLLSLEEFQFLEPDQVVSLNVGGQIFETPVSVLTRDPNSILAACCRRLPHPDLVPHGEKGMLFFDRDWWLFRHIIAFLRSNVLPNDLETLKELYIEAQFYRLHLLAQAIKDYPVDAVVVMNSSTGI